MERQSIKSILQRRKDGIVSTVPLASNYARKLVDAERAASGQDVHGAIGAVARRLHSTSGTVWNLLFRAPKTVAHDLFVALEAATEKQILNDIGRLENELAAVRASARRLSPRAVEEAESSLARLRASLRSGGDA